jgi:SAM-dependent methyltransferase
MLNDSRNQTTEIGKPGDSQGSYQPRLYWENRLQSNFNLRGVGHIGFSESYNKWLYRRKEAVIKALFCGVNLAGKHVLDIGCGTGFFVAWYLRRGAQVSGIDITDVSVREMSKQFEGHFRTQDIADRNYEPSAVFDVVNMWDVIYHIVDDRALDHALNNIARSLKHHGLLLFTDRLGAQCDARIAPHVRYRALSTHKKLLGQRGFAFVGAKPLYRMLDVPHFGSKLDNYLGRFYYLLDKYQRELATDNLSVSAWRRES